MLALLGFCCIAGLLFLIMTKLTSVIVALVITPIVFGILAGFTPKLGEFALKGITGVAPTAVMLTFAILYFGIMYDAGMFDPIIRKIIRFGGGDPVKIVIGTALVGMVAHLDGSGASTFMIAVPAMLPIYNMIGIDKKILACVVALAAGTMNMVPWGGPTARAASSLKVNIEDIFNPLIPALVVGLLGVLAISYWLGKKEKARLQAAGVRFDLQGADLVAQSNAESPADQFKRPKLLWFNILLTALAIYMLVSRALPLAVVFLIALPIALIVNYPNPKMQQERIIAQGKTAILMIAVILSAGIFTGILTNSGMLKAMAEAIVAIVPIGWGDHFPILTAITSMPASLLFDPDSYYFGVLPVLASASEAMGVPAIEVARAAILGQMTTGFPVSPLTASTFLLIGLSGVDLGEHQKFTIPFAFAITILMTIVAVATGAFRL